MKTNNPIPGMYLRIAGIELADAEETRPRARLWPATAVLLSVTLAVASACGPNSDDALPTGSRANRIQALDCSGDDGVAGSGDDSCTATAGTTNGGDSSDGSDVSGVSASLTTDDASADTSVGSTGVAPPPPPPAIIN